MNIVKQIFSRPKLLTIFPFYILLLSFGTFLLPLVYSESLLHKASLTKYVFILIISVSAFIAWLIPRTKDGKLYFSTLFLLLISIFIFSASSILWSQFKGLYQIELIHFGALLLISFLAMQVKQTNQLQLILFSAITGGAVSALLAFIQVWGWNPLSYGILGFPAAAFINKNHLANYIDLLVPVSLFLLVTTDKNLLKWLSSICTSLLFSYLIFSHNRASWISLLSTFILILYFSYKLFWLQEKFKNIDTKYVALIIILSLGLINSPGSSFNETNRFKSLYTSLENTEVMSSTTLRLNAYNNATKMIKANPLLGTGLGSFHIAFKPYSYNIDENKHVKSNFMQLHNDPLQIFVELGIIGGLLCISFVFLLIRKHYSLIIAVSPTSQNINKYLIHFSLLLAITASIIHSFLSFPLHLPASSFLIFLFIGLIMNAATIEISLRKKIILLLMTAIFIFLFYSSKFYYSYTNSSYQTNLAIHSLFNYHPKTQYNPITEPASEANCIMAKKHIKKALNTYSNDFYIQGWAYIIYLQCTKNQKEHLNLAHKILSDNPYHNAALENAAGISFNKKDYSSAKRYYQILHFLYPLDAGYTLLLGHVAVKQKDYVLAYNFYKKTLKLQPQNKIAPDMINQLISKGYIKTEPTKK